LDGCAADWLVGIDVVRAPAGTIVMSGVTRTDNAGITCSSIRFSPLKMFPS
jgi:hypothetical protein